MQGEPIGFVTWHAVYDLHWARGGAEIGDLYVAPAHRGVGAALAMVAAVCVRPRARSGATPLSRPAGPTAY